MKASLVCNVAIIGYGQKKVFPFWHVEHNGNQFIADWTACRGDAGVSATGELKLLRMNSTSAPWVVGDVTQVRITTGERRAIQNIIKSYFTSEYAGRRLLFILNTPLNDADFLTAIGIDTSQPLPPAEACHASDFGIETTLPFEAIDFEFDKQ